MRHVGWMIIVIAALHMLTAAVLFTAPLQDMFVAGLFDTVRPPPMSATVDEPTLRMTQRAFVTWFLYAGLAFMLLGLLIRDLEARGARLPISLGYGLLAIVAINAVLSPLSGVWLLLIPALSVLRAARGT